MALVFTATSRTAILHEEVLQDSSSSNSSSNSSSYPTRAHYREFSIQNPILHTEDKELFEYYSPVSRNSTHRRQGDLLELHPCVLQDLPQTFQSFMTFQPFQAILQILQCSSISRKSTPFQHSPIRMHILQFDWFPQKTPPSTSWTITNITVRTFILQRKGDVAISVKLTDYSK